MIIGVTTGFVGSSLSPSSSFTYAVLDIEPVAFSFTVTWNVTVVVPAVSPDLAGTFTSIPLSKLSAVYEVSASFTFILPSTNVVFVGISSLTITVPSAEPLFVTVIVYVIVSPSTTAVLSAVLF